METNQKAEKFTAYCKENDIDFFKRFDTRNDDDTVMFQSGVQIDTYTIPFFVIMDDSIFTVIRAQLAWGLINDENRDAVNAFINSVNRSSKLFKYITSDEGNVLLDIDYISTPEFFDMDTLRDLMDALVLHLKEEYRNLLRAGGLLPKTRAN